MANVIPFNRLEYYLNFKPAKTIKDMKQQVQMLYTLGRRVGDQKKAKIMACQIYKISPETGLSLLIDIADMEGENFRKEKYMQRWENLIKYFKKQLDYL